VLIQGRKAASSPPRPDGNTGIISYAIADLVDTVLATSPDKVEQYRAGKTALFGFFVVQVIKGSQGKANPRVVQQLVRERLG